MTNLLIKDVRSTSGGRPGINLDVNCTDDSSYTIPRIARREFRDATIAILEKDGKTISMVKVLEFDGDNRPIKWEHLVGEKLQLDGTENIVDCRTEEHD